MSTSTNQNSRNKPWSLQGIIDNAPNWSLAGDAGLLKYLEAFSEDLLGKAETTSDNLDGLLEDLNSASLKLDVVKNEFCSLHNIQFIESRVYEEDETLPVEPSSTQVRENVEDKKPAEEERIASMKEAVLRGIEVVDQYFEKVEVPASDSEDETDFPSFVLRPKDPYIDRTLPYIIGTEEWYNKWHVGLLDSSSDSETEKVSEKYSDSDSEGDLPVQDRSQFKVTSNRESQDNLSRHINQPQANSTFDDSIKQPDLFGSSDSEEYNSVPVQAPISNRSFAQELAAKLGDVIEQTQDVEPVIKKRPIQGTATNTHRIIGNLFSDEPPPIDEQEDALFGNPSIQQGFFSGGGGLFDDFEKNSGLWKKDVDKTRVSAPKSKLPDLFNDEEDDIFITGASHAEAKITPELNQQRTKPKQISKGLFDEDASDEDDLFNESTVQPTPSKPFLLPGSKTTVPFYDDEPPELESKVSAKKPVGGVKIFGETDLFKQQKIDDVLKIRRRDSYESSDAGSVSKISTESKDLFGDLDTTKREPDKAIEKPVTKEKEATLNKVPEKDVKQLSLFDDDDDVGGDGLFEGDLFSTQKFTSSLFDEEPLGSDLFGQTVSESLEKSVSKLVTDESDKAGPMQETSKSTEILDKDGAGKLGKSLAADEIFQSTKKSAQDSLDSFLLPAEGESSKRLDPTGDSSTEDGSLFKTAKSTASLDFLDQNPPDDDDWDTKSENNLFEENDPTLFENAQEVSSQRSGLFDNEPPSLLYESSGIVRDFSARNETDDSFNPYASSSRRFSTDIFNEQQSSDSFFVTKNKSHFDSHPAQANFDNILEISDVQDDSEVFSNVDITPSGNVDELFSDSTVSIGDNSLAEQDGTKSGETAAQSVNLSESLGSDDLSVAEGETDGAVAPKPKPTVAAKPNNSPVKEKQPSLDVVDQAQTSVEDPVLGKIGSPGKLKHNLRINVGALIPGAALPKRKDLEKSHSVEEAPPSKPKTSQSHESFVAGSHTQSKSSEHLAPVADPQKSIERSVSFEDSNFAEVLPSITKDRVRIPVKRRPSTRKARHESIRSSGIDFKIDLAAENDPEREEKVVEAKGAPIATKSIFGEHSMPQPPSTDGAFDGLFDDQDIFSSNTTKTDEKSLFDSLGSDFPLFADLNDSRVDVVTPETSTKGRNLESQPEPKLPVVSSDSFESDLLKSGLFDDSEEFDDLFSSRKLPPKSSILKKSLFDDDDDDLFGTASNFEKSASVKGVGDRKVPEKKSKTLQVKKLENTQVEEDPLSAFNEGGDA